MSETDGELDLEDYLSLLRRRWRWVAGTVLVVAGLTAAFTLTRDEVYQSRSEVQILTDDNQAVFNVRDEELHRNALAELQYLSSGRYAKAVDDLAGFPVDVDAGPRFVNSQEQLENIGLLRFIVEESSPQRAAGGAAAAAEAYLAGRVDELITSFERQRSAVVTERTELIAARDELNDQLIEAVEAAAGATDPIEQALLAIDRDSLISELQPRVDNLNERLAGRNAAIANLDDLLLVLAEPQSTARLSLDATVPSEPISPDVPRNILVGVIVGIVLGAILAVMRDLLDTRAHDGAELAQLVDIPVMATISEIRTQRSAPGRVRRYRDLSPEEASGYQVLLNSLWLSNVDDPLQSIVVTSDRPGVGKTQTVVNLAQAEAARGTRVLVIDTDFVNPSVATRLDVEATGPGLLDVLDGTATMEMATTPTAVENLDLISASGGEGAGELLRSDRLGALLADLYDGYDLIIIDSPPTLSTADSRLVASQADAVVVVYDPAQSRREELQRTIDLLRSARANLIGLVANRSRASHPVYLSARDR